MTGKRINLCFVIIVLLFIACTPEHQRLIEGKWVLASKITGTSPRSYWFQKNGKVVAPWEERVSQLKSSGTYTFIEDTHIKIIMNEGPYSGITFFFEIVRLNEKELILRGSIQDIHMKRAE